MRTLKPGQTYVDQDRKINAASPVADEAARWLENLKNYKIPLTDLDELRGRMIHHITACQQDACQSR